MIDYDEFKKELQALLRKYEVMLKADCHPASDLYGVNGEKMIAITSSGTEIKLADGWWIDANNLEACA